MKRLQYLILFLFVLPMHSQTVQSPSGKIKFIFSLLATGKSAYQVTSKSKIKLHLAKGGGAAISFKPIN